MQDYYEILGVPRFSEDTQEFRRAYKEQVLFFHPDKGNVNESIALERTQLLNEAYKTLKDPAEKTMAVLPVLPKPVLVMIAIVVLLCTVTFIDMIYRAASGIVSPSEIDSGIFTFGNDRNDVSFRVKVIVL